MPELPTAFPHSTGGDTQYRIIFCAPFCHRPFPWSRKTSVGFNDVYELDLPEGACFDDLSPAVEAEVSKALLSHVREYISSKSGFFGHWQLVCKLQGNHHRFIQVSANSRISMILLSRPLRHKLCPLARGLLQKGEMPIKWRYECAENDQAQRKEKGKGKQRDSSESSSGDSPKVNVDFEWEAARKLELEAARKLRHAAASNIECEAAWEAARKLELVGIKSAANPAAAASSP